MAIISATANHRPLRHDADFIGRVREPSLPFLPPHTTPTEIIAALFGANIEVFNSKEERKNAREKRKKAKREERKRARHLIRAAYL